VSNFDPVLTSGFDEEGMKRALIKRKTIPDPETEAKLQNLLREPVGSPIKLTREEALAIVNAGIGARPDLPTGATYVREVSKIWRGIAKGD
jgi:hypothetical protein